jgi:CHAT domain-containing protein
LMRRFYRGVLVAKQTPASALAAAQRAMHRDPRWQSPYYWAAFTLIGDWR